MVAIVVGLAACSSDDTPSLDVAPEAFVVASPDGSTAVAVWSEARGVWFRLFHDGEPALEPSRLQIEFDQASFLDSVAIVATDAGSERQFERRMVAGKRLELVAPATEAEVTIENAPTAPGRTRCSTAEPSPT